MRKFLTAFLALAAAGALPAHSESGHVSEKALEAGLRRAERVVVATVSEVNAAFEVNSFGDRLIITRAKLQEEEAIKGKPLRALDYAVEGGTIGDLTLHVSHTPEPPRQGQRAIFLLRDSKEKGAWLPDGDGSMLELDGDRIKGSALKLEDVRRLAGSRAAGN